MKKIASFAVDHRLIDIGIYLSRVDGDISTYDLRMRKPNTGDTMSNASMHSFEHIFATLARSSNISDKVIYVGPMGCQTGFYLLMRSNDHSESIAFIKDILREIICYKGQMPGKSEAECGNYINLSIELAKQEAIRYLSLVENWTEDMLAYKI